MADEMNSVSTENQNHEVQKDSFNPQQRKNKLETVNVPNRLNPFPEQKSAGCVGLGFSFFIPLIGIILYFAKKSEKFDASGYLYAAIAGFVIGFILRIATGAIQ